MVWKKYEDQTADEVIQNYFTSYLATAVGRKRTAYIDKLNYLRNFVSFDFSNMEDESFDLEKAAFKSLPIHLRLENERLFLAVTELSEREKYIFFQRVLGEMSLSDIAAELGMSYQAVAVAYHRIIHKLRKRIQGDVK